MKHNRIIKVQFRYLVLLIGVLSALVISIVWNREMVTIIMMIAIYLSSIACIKFDITHPYVWFIGMLLIYSIGYPLLVLNGELVDHSYELNKTLIYEMIGMITLIFVITPKTIEYDIKKLNLRYKYISRILFFVSIFGVGIYISYISRMGYSSKYQISLDNSIFTKFDFFLSYLALSYLVLLLNGKKILHQLPVNILFFSLGVIVVMIAGERDFILKLILIYVFYHNIFIKKISLNVSAFSAIAGLLFINVLSSLKNIMVRGTFLFADKSFLRKIFSDEFISASRNFTELVSRHDIWNYYCGKTLIGDILRSLSFGFLKVNRTYSKSATQIFNEIFNPSLIQRGGGHGFSILGEGYMNFGIYGVVIWSIMLGLIIRMLYYNSNKNPFCLAIYILSIPIIIYAIRADFANILSQSIKHVYLPIIILYFLRKKGSHEKVNCNISSISRS
jgi:oligosaccharide repeat unit polymerase